MEKHENVTEIDFDVAGFSRRYVSEDGIEVLYFYVEKGIERGIIGVTGENNQTVGIWHDNPNYVATLDECTTIDSDEYSEGKLLKQACSPRILTLVGITPMLADIEGSLNDKMDLCGGIYNIGDSISIRDHNWQSGGYGLMTCRQALTHKSNVALFKILLVNHGDNAFGIWKKMTSDEKQTNAMEFE